LDLASRQPIEREWSDATGKFKITATYVDSKQGYGCSDQRSTFPWRSQMSETMLKQILLTIFALQAFAADDVRAEGPVWIRRFDDAQKAAQSEGKDLFIVFTGHGWCHACELLPNTSGQGRVADHALEIGVVASNFSGVE
jgi:hypothetical protein